MNDNDNDNTGDKPDNVLPFRTVDKSANGQSHSKFSGSNLSKEDFPIKKYLIDLEDDTIMVEGFVAINASFLVIGNAEGGIKFAANGNCWRYLTDVTDQNIHDGPAN